jgi:ATPase family associated with various cellular activities (AAA)
VMGPTPQQSAPSDGLAFLRFAIAALAAIGPDGNPDAPEVADTRREMIAGLSDGQPFSSIVANARLNTAEVELFAVLLAAELDTSVAATMATLQGSNRLDHLLLGTAARLLGGIGRCAQAAGPGSGLQRSAFIQVVHDGPWAVSRIVLQPSVVWSFAGNLVPDPDLPVGTFWIEDFDTGGDSLVVVSGPDRVRRRQVAARRAAGTSFLVTPTPAEEREWSAIVREATLTGSGVIVELDDSLPEAGRRWIEKATHLPWGLTMRDELALRGMPSRPWMEYEGGSERPSDAEWTEAFGADTPRAHRLSAEQIEIVGKAFTARGDDLDAAVRRLLAGPLVHLAKRIRPRRGWSDLILSEDRLEQLRGIALRYRYADTVYDQWGFSASTGRGIVALFSGGPGTGKTLAAEIVAGELELDLFKIDISAVVSKYIGETEKHLEQIFDAASVGNVVLFFDEADSIFGKRTEVKDSHDRYSNLEVSYLLQRLESYEGIVILGTNFQKNIDEAFLRRIHSLVEFPSPAVREREALWVQHLPKAAPVGNIDVAWLAERFEMAGGSIRNAIVEAAFAAAAADQPIAMGHIVHGLTMEYRKMGRLLKPNEFGPYAASA